MNTKGTQLTSLEREWRSQQQMISKLSRKLHACQLEFVEVELKIGLTFASFALAARHDARKEARCERLARHAYNAARRFGANVQWSPITRKDLARKTRQLEKKLAKLAARRALLL